MGPKLAEKDRGCEEKGAESVESCAVCRDSFSPPPSFSRWGRRGKVRTYVEKEGRRPLPEKCACPEYRIGTGKGGLLAH